MASGPRPHRVWRNPTVKLNSEFHRGKLQDLVALLSGRNFETKQYEEVIAGESFARLKKGIVAFINKTHFDHITMILRSAGFVSSDLIGGPQRGELRLHQKLCRPTLPSPSLRQSVGCFVISRSGLCANPSAVS